MSTSHTQDPTPIEPTFPTMPEQEEFRHLGYALIDLVARHLYQVRLRSPYRPIPAEARQALELLPLPEHGVRAKEIVAFFEERIQPYPTFGLGHPRAFGWVAGGSDPMAVLGSLLLIRETRPDRFGHGQPFICTVSEVRPPTAPTAPP